MINEPCITNYLQSLQEINKDASFEQIEHYAKENGVPIMDLGSLGFLLNLLRIQSPKVIIEIGTAIGYSAIRMALACPLATIYTFERDEIRLAEARKNINQFQLQDRIIIIEGDALENASHLPKGLSGDILFIDAAKGKNQEFFQTYEPYLGKRSIVVTDNVLFRGYVAKEEGEIPKRYHSMVRKLKTFHRWLLNHKCYDTAIIPVGDGLAISVRKEDSNV